jgi:protein ImuB
MRRLVSVWLPDWPVTAWSRRAGRHSPPDDQPFALIDKGTHGLALHALNRAAKALGLWRGQAHADACAAAPHLVSAPAEPEADLADLKKLALWGERFSPAVTVDAAMPALEGLSLDMTGGAHLFGGEGAMLADLCGRLARVGIPARAAMADTLGCAWAVARYSGKDQVVVEAGSVRQALADLPVQALRIEPSAVQLLGRFGIKRIGDLYGLPRAGLARRFRGPQGLAVVERLDQALGAAPEPLEPQRPAPRYRTWRVFAEPLLDPEGVAHQLPELVERLAGQLERDGQGARALRLTAFRVDNQATAIEARLSVPSARPAHLVRLLKEKGLERLNLGFGADALMLSALVVEPLCIRQGEMEGEGRIEAQTALASLIDRLQARLGDKAVKRPVLKASWIPERAERWIPAGVEASPVEAPTDRPRPILLFDPPEPVEAIAEAPDGLPARFTWRRVARKVVKAAGPERLSPEWWKPWIGPGSRTEPPRTRDYYRVEDEHGRRYWLFREGLYGREDVSMEDLPKGGPAPRPPSWWLNGVFG